jgi:hypothetical protein
MQILNLWYLTRLHSVKTMQRLDRLLQFSKSNVAQFRFQVINYHQKYGTKPTVEAYGIPKPTIYRWKKVLEGNQGRITALIPKSTVPQNKRRMIVDPRIIEFLKNERKKHLIGKEKLKPLLDEYCLSIGLISPSESLIGKIIKRSNIFYRQNGKCFHNAQSKYLNRKANYKFKIKKSPKPEEFGYLEIDTITKFNFGIKRYVFNAIDCKLKFQFSYAYKSLSSIQARNFMEKLEQVYPIKNGIKTVQTDNGLEFMGEFDRYLKQKQITHAYIYPRCPKINGFIERANRTLQEEYLNQRLDGLFTDIKQFNYDLMDHLIWYNTKRIHKSLNNISPINYLLKTVPESQKYVTYTNS